MVLDYLEKEKNRQRFLEAGERKKEQQASEGIFHENRYHVEPHRHGRRKPVEGLKQHCEDRGKEKEMHEIFQIENAYGRISLGMNDKKETTLVVGREKYHNGPTMGKGKKEINEETAYHWRGKAGDRELNKKAPAESAYALKSTEKNENESRFQGDVLLKETEKFGARTGQHALLTLLPVQTGNRTEDREAYAFHEKVARRMEQAMRQELKRPERTDDFMKKRRLSKGMDLTREEERGQDEEENGLQKNTIFG